MKKSKMQIKSYVSWYEIILIFERKKHLFMTSNFVSTHPQAVIYRKQIFILGIKQECRESA